MRKITVVLAVVALGLSVAGLAMSVHSVVKNEEA